MKTIIAAVDFSSATELVVAEAAKLARSLGARIFLFHVTEPVAKVVDLAVISMSVAGIDEGAMARAKTRLQEISAELNSTGLSAEILQAIGSPGWEIADQAKKLSADYIVTGSHGHSAFHELVMGSTTSVVLKHAACPVVIVRPAPIGRRATAEGVQPGSRS